MNICLVTMEWPPYGCGIGSYMYNLARGLVGLGHKVTVITHDQSPAPVPGVAVFSVPISTGPLTFVEKVERKMKGLLCGIACPWSWRAHKVFRSINENEPFDIIETAEFGAWGYHFLKNGQVPIVVRCHNPGHVVWSINQTGKLDEWDFPRRVRKQDRLEWQQAAWADGIVSPSEALAYHLSLAWVIPLSRFRVIPNPIDADLFHPASNPSGSKEILYVGRFEYNKGVYDLAEALPDLFAKYPEATARFVGMDRPVAAPYRHYGATASQAILGMIPPEYHHRVAFTAPVPVAEIVRFQQGALCAVMPTRGFESFSYTVLEPMACGTPVVATRCGGPSEIITHGVDGLLVPPGDVRVLVESLLRLLSDHELRATLSLVARKTVETRYALPVIIPKILEWYEHIMNKFKKN